jgi:hypothetical protein
MAFEVRWRKEAIESITRIFDGADDQALIAIAIGQIDRELSVDPGTKGESRPAGRRIVFEPPLAALIPERRGLWKNRQEISRSVNSSVRLSQHGLVIVDSGKCRFQIRN